MADGQRELDRRTRAPALHGRQQIDNRRSERCGLVLLVAGEDRATGGPANQPRCQDRSAFDKQFHSFARPSSRLQLVPPNPNALLIAISTGSLRLPTRY